MSPHAQQLARVFAVSSRAALAHEDYELWQTHEVGVLHESVPGSASPSSWAGGEVLLREALVLAPEDAVVGAVGGAQLAASPPLHGAARLARELCMAIEPLFETDDERFGVSKAEVKVPDAELYTDNPNQPDEYDPQSTDEINDEEYIGDIFWHPPVVVMRR